MVAIDFKDLRTVCACYGLGENKCHNCKNYGGKCSEETCPEIAGEVVRCKDCKHRKKYIGKTVYYCELMHDKIGSDGYMLLEWYCADGERRNNND